MGRKQRHLVTLKPFCYYCDKEFNNEIILHQHQKARHFNCVSCRKRFSTAPALGTHIIQVHKDKIQRVPNAKAGRDTFDISIYGMDGVTIELINYKLAEKVQMKKKKLIRENKLAEDEDAKDEKGKHKSKNRDSDIQALLSNGTSGFYHNPNSINLTLEKNQRNKMFSNINPLATLGSMPMMGFPGNLPMHMQSQLQNQIQNQLQMQMAMSMPQQMMGIPIPVQQGFGFPPSNVGIDNLNSINPENPILYNQNNGEQPQQPVEITNNEGENEDILIEDSNKK